MFFFGIIDQSLHIFFGIVLGFEFESKKVPFGARHIIGNLSTGSILGILTLSPVETQGEYRSFFIASLLIGLSATILMFFMKFKKVD